MGVAGEPITFRAAEPEDATEVTQLFVRVCHHIYADFAPQKYLDKLTVANRLAGWQKVLEASRPQEGFILAESGGQLWGFVYFGPASNPEMGDGGEVKYLFVDIHAQGAGLGRTLLEAAFTALAQMQFSAARLAVVDGNAKALAFYQHLGGQLLGTFVDGPPEWPTKDLVLGWSLEDYK